MHSAAASNARANADTKAMVAGYVAGFSVAEARRLFGPRPALPAAVEKDYLTPWPAETAKRRFLERFATLAEA